MLLRKQREEMVDLEVQDTNEDVMLELTKENEALKAKNKELNTKVAELKEFIVRLIKL